MLLALGHPVAGLAMGLAFALAACGDDASTAPAEARGIVVLDGDAAAAWLGADGSEPVRVALATPSGSSWLAASAEGRLVTISPDAIVSVSDAQSSAVSNPQPNWTTLDVTDAPNHQVPGPYAFPTWDPTSTRIALLAMPEDGPTTMVIADADSGGVATSVVLDGPDRPQRPTWVGPDQIAVQMWVDDDTTVEPVIRNVIVDVETAAVTDGPARPAWLSSPDGSLVLTTSAARPANGPFVIQTTDAWLAGDNASVATLAEPSEIGAYSAFAFSPEGDAVVLSVSEVSEKVSEHIFTAASGWKDVAATPSRDRRDPIALAWLP